MNQNILDIKLKNLIQVCKESRNYKKLAVTIFILVNNQINEIGIKLGIRPRNRSSKEKIFEYMEKINSVFEQNLTIFIFKKDQIDSLRECEILFLRNKGNIPYHFIKTMFHIYYDLRKIEVPNLHKALQENRDLKTSQMGLFTFLSPNTNRKENNSSKLKPLIIQKIQQQELSLQKDLKNQLNSQKIETAIYLRMMRKSLNSKKNKIKFQGTLKDNLIYQNSKETILEYTIIGLITLFLSLSVIIFTEFIFFPMILSHLNTWFVICIGCLIFLVLIYLKQFRRGVD